jgi:hypothetical protein
MFENNFHEKSENKFQTFSEPKRHKNIKQGIFPEENINTNKSQDYLFSLNPETSEWWKRSNVRDSTNFFSSNETFFDINNSNKKNKNDKSYHENDKFFTKSRIKIGENRPNMTTIKPLFSLISSQSNSQNTRKGIL